MATTIFYLNILLDWARRAGSDKLLYYRDVLTSDGTNTVVLQNDGNVIISQLFIGGVLQASNTYSNQVAVVTLGTTPPTGTQIVVTYNRSVFSDTEVLAYLTDAANDTIVTLSLSQWQMNTSDPTNPQIAYPTPPNQSGVMLDMSGIGTGPPLENAMDQRIQHLIVLKAAILMRQELANQNADQAILIKDGDTTIDTSKTAAASEKAVARLEEQYRQALRIAIANRQTGMAIQNNWVPLPYPWSSPNMMPGEVNGPTY